MRKQRRTSAAAMRIDRAKRTLHMSAPVSPVTAARMLRLRYLVVRRLIISAKLNSKLLDGRWFFVERSDVNRALKERPWKPWAMRRFKLPGATSRM